MATASLNIVELIENNPNSRLSNTYQHKLLTKIKAKFSENEQQMFVASFYCYLNHDVRNDYVIDLDDVWKWLEFYTKQKAKDLLERYFTLDKDYKKSLTPQGKQTIHMKGGHNKETFMLNIDTFKKICLKAGTKKADDIHDYYIKLEETLHEVLQEESDELKLQIEQKNIELQQQVILSEKDKELLKEKTILEHFPQNTQCVYYGIIDDVSNTQEKLIKFGNSNHLKLRVKKHKDTYTNFRLVNAFKVDNKLQIENAIKSHPIFTERTRSLTINYKNYIELLQIDGLNFIDLDKIFRDIITSIEYSPENYVKLLNENMSLKKQIRQIQDTNQTNHLILIKADNDRLLVENLKLIRKYNTLKLRTNDQIDDSNLPINVMPTHHSDIITPSKTSTQSGNVIAGFKKNMRNKQGFYIIAGQEYIKNEGTRQEVWDCVAYQTSGLLIKNDLIVNKLGKIVSKKKCILAALQNHLEDYNASR
jgi:hypothetical protein